MCKKQPTSILISSSLLPSPSPTTDQAANREKAGSRRAAPTTTSTISPTIPSSRRRRRRARLGYEGARRHVGRRRGRNVDRRKRERGWKEERFVWANVIKESRTTNVPVLIRTSRCLCFASFLTNAACRSEKEGERRLVHAQVAFGIACQGLSLVATALCDPCSASSSFVKLM